MKKIEFGFNNDQEANSSWEEIGISGSKKSFKLLEMDSKIIATSMLPEVLDEMNEVMKYNQSSITTLAMNKSKIHTM
jgi:hypothetical protein